MDPTLVALAQKVIDAKTNAEEGTAARALARAVLARAKEVPAEAKGFSFGLEDAEER